MAGTMNQMHVVRFTAVANGVVATTFTVTRPATVTDFVLIAADGAAQTVQLSSTGGNISAALAFTADTTLARPAKAGVWTNANTAIVAGNALTCTPNGAKAYEAYVYLYPTAGVALL